MLLQHSALRAIRRRQTLATCCRPLTSISFAYTLRQCQAKHNANVLNYGGTPDGPPPPPPLQLLNSRMNTLVLRLWIKSSTHPHITGTWQSSTSPGPRRGATWPHDGHSNFTTWIKYFKFKTEPKGSPLNRIPRSTNYKLYFTVFPTSFVWLSLISVGWLICCDNYVTSLILWTEMNFACHWPHCSRTFRYWQVFIRPKECAEVMTILTENCYLNK
jgi:hypothetical protein